MRPEGLGLGLHVGLSEGFWAGALRFKVEGKGLRVQESRIESKKLWGLIFSGSIFFRAWGFRGCGGLKHSSPIAVGFRRPEG